MTAAFILTRDEWNFARTGEGAAVTLLEKGLAIETENGEISLIRELKTVAEEARSAVTEEIEPGVFALRGVRFCMMIEPYRLISDTLKISLYKDHDALLEAIQERRNCNG
jgi:hypothetical protein